MRAQHTITIGLLALTLPSAASAYELKAGTWQVHQGLGFDQQSAGRSTRSICVEPTKTQTNVNWFISLAQPNESCNTRVISETASEIRLQFSCKQNGSTLNAPSVIRLSPDRITVENQLNWDLPNAPLSLGQTRTVFHVSDSCLAH